MKWLVVGFLALIFGAVAEARPRVVVMTDITNEPDDTMSLVRFLLYADVFEVEGLIATTSCWKKEKPDVGEIHRVLDAYEKVQPSLGLHSKDYPTADYLRRVTRSGVEGYGMGAVAGQLGNEGIARIVEVLERDDPRPVWFLAWGGANTLGGAVMKLEAERPDTVGGLMEKVRGYEIALQDDGFAFIAHRYPKTKLISARLLWKGISRTVPKFNRWPESWGGNDRVFDGAWIAENVQRGHGALGEIYPTADYLWEGDSPSFLYLVPNGLNFPEEVEFGGWGGRFGKERVMNVRSGTGNDTVDGLLDRHRDYGLFSDAVERWSFEGKVFESEFAGVFRWREDFQNDFAARMDRCVKGVEKVNHAPIGEVNGDDGAGVVRLRAKAGSELVLDAKGSFDPDGDALSYGWSVYAEAGSYGGEIGLEGSGSERVVVRVPEDGGGKNFHVILRVGDDGEPALCGYRRVVVEVE